MQGQIDLFTLLAMIVAVIAVLKLRSVLGRRTDEDDSRIERRAREETRTPGAGGAAGSDKVVTLPRRDRDEAVGEARTDAAEVESRVRAFAKGDDAVANGLLDIQKLDRDFDPEHFVAGARQAYEIIVTAFAEGNRKALRDLLSREVLDGFTSSIAEREARGERVEQNFVGINKADILEAEVSSRGVASVTVRFVSQLITATRDKAGNVIDGDETRIKDVTDIWTFSRDISSKDARRNLNWKLVGTQAPN